MVFSKIMETPLAFKNFDVLEDGLIYLKLDDQRILCISAIKSGYQSLWEIIISEAHSLLAHLGS